MKSTEEIVIETSGLSKSYREVLALSDLNLRVLRHSICGFLGPNGAGKTTTMKLLLGLVRPTSGSGRIFGRDIVHEGIAIRMHVGYLPQEPHYYDYLTTRETLRLTASFFYTGSRAAIESRISETLDLVGLAEKANRPTGSLSGGELQRLGIAQAQVNAPKLLILDEPTASLDPEGRHDILTLLQRLRQQTTIFFSTHLLDDVQRISDFVVIIDHGKLVLQSSIADLLARNSTGTFQLALVGEPQGLHQLRHLLSLQPWIIEVVSPEQTTFQAYHGQVDWLVRVNNVELAHRHLLRLLLSEQQVNVVAFQQQRLNLEEIFLQLVANRRERFYA